MNETARLDAIRGALRAHGLRATPARIAVLVAVDGSEAALSHADLFARVASDHDRTTIFRALNALTRSQLIQRLDVGDRVWRYRRARDEAASGASFWCSNCGAVQDLRGLRLVGQRRGTPRALAKGDVQIVIRGLCDRCR